MSSYFQALNRLAAESGQPQQIFTTAVADKTKPREVVVDAPAKNVSPGRAPDAVPVPPTPELPGRVWKRPQSPNRFTGVLDRIQEQRGTVVGACIVVAPVCSSQAVQRTVAGIAVEAERSGLSTLTMRAIQ